MTSAPRHELEVFRCECPRCARAVEDLLALAEEFGAEMSVQDVRACGVEELAGWATPLVYVNGLEISRFGSAPSKWRAALATSAAWRRIAGEVIDLSCYEGEGKRGRAHRDCADLCVSEIGLPLGLLTAEGEAYRLAAERGQEALLVDLKGRLGRHMALRGAAYRFENKRSLRVAELDLGMP